MPVAMEEQDPGGGGWWEKEENQASCLASQAWGRSNRAEARGPWKALVVKLRSFYLARSCSHAYNPSTQEAEAYEFQALLHSETLSQKKKQKKFYSIL
jgi:hypothetical protein